jgi:mRNA-degrading endonuclease RelE of RelBE toxin-antitoxin system
MEVKIKKEAQKGNPIRYRLRVGDWRIIFNVSSDTLIIETIKHRREAYQK